MKWADAPSGGGGGVARSVQVISTNTTAANAANTHYVYVFTAAVTLTLPAVTGSGNSYLIKNTSGGVATVSAAGSDLIDGETQMILQNFQSYTLYDIGNATWIVT